MWAVLAVSAWACDRAVCALVVTRFDGQALVIPVEGPEIEADLGTWGNATFGVVTDPDEVLRVELAWRVETTLGLSLEGPHVELAKGPFATTEWRDWPRGSLAPWKMPEWPDPLPRPAMTAAQVVEAFRVQSGGDARFVEAARACAPSCPVALSRFQVRIRATGGHPERTVEHVVSVRAVTGC